MEVFVEESEISESRESVVASLKQAFVKGVPGLEDENYFLPLAPRASNEFLLKDFQSVVWGKVFFEAISEADKILLAEQIKNLRDIYDKRIRPVFFFPENVWQGKGVAAEFFASYFEYAQLRSPSSRALRIRSFTPEAAATKKKSVRLESPSQLSREELSELIDLSLKLK